MKMKKIFFYTAALLIVFVFTGTAKDFKFCVLGKKGTVQVKTSKSKKYEDIKTGDKLFVSDNIVLKEGSYIGLVHNNGKTIEIAKPGKYKISSLSILAEDKKTSVLPKLADMIFDKVNKSGELLTDKETKTQKTGGYIERGIGDVYLPIVTPVKKHIMINNVTLCWNSSKGNPQFEFKLMNRFNKILLSKSTSDTCITFDAESMKLEKGNYYFWTVNLASDNDYKSKEACFKILTNNEIALVKDTLNQLKEELGDDNTATAKIVYAFFYEQNNLLDEAENSYRQAIKLAPDVYDYVVLYEDYLARIKSRDR